MRIIASIISLLLSLTASPMQGANSPRSSSLPKVELGTVRGGPREVEDLTRQKILRDYAFAWQTLATGLDQNRPDILNDYFTGFANKQFKQAIAEQAASGIHRQYVDHGHKLEVIFYSPDGGVMQLWDNADYDVQIFDGTRLLHSERSSVRFLVLMTPAADRWMVRLMQDVPVS
jgi:hypothetical protein